LLKAVVDAETEQILGAAVLAPEGGELMSNVRVGDDGKLSYRVLEDAVFAHPAYAESLNTLWGHFEKIRLRRRDGGTQPANTPGADVHPDR